LSPWLAEKGKSAERGCVLAEREEPQWPGVDFTIVWSATLGKEREDAFFFAGREKEDRPPTWEEGQRRESSKA